MNKLTENLKIINQDRNAIPFLDWGGVTVDNFNMNRINIISILDQYPEIFYYLPPCSFMTAEEVISLLKIDFNFIFSEQIYLSFNNAKAFGFAELKKLIEENQSVFNKKSINSVERKFLPPVEELLDTLVCCRDHISNIRFFNLKIPHHCNLGFLTKLAKVAKSTEELKRKGKIDKSLIDYLNEDKTIYFLPDSYIINDVLIHNPILSSIFSVANLRSSEIFKIMKKVHKQITKNYNLEKFGKIEIIHPGIYEKIININPSSQEYVNLFELVNETSI